MSDGGRPEEQDIEVLTRSIRNKACPIYIINACFTCRGSAYDHPAPKIPATAACETSLEDDPFSFGGKELETHTFA
ncbi:hypothetical protein JTE90_014639 [Oedothorax gibbosus]|uniref:Uncharacterized protein n=1 Tax=Oedothorax gibbosus TaxID=931172 RepID=A0AAV6V9S6_9ARAC|nr:hypothetical protein JTE90_014639 [Oedothorax gibbosus]